MRGKNILYDNPDKYIEPQMQNLKKKEHIRRLSMAVENSLTKRPDREQLEKRHIFQDSINPLFIFANHGW